MIAFFKDPFQSQHKKRIQSMTHLYYSYLLSRNFLIVILCCVSLDPLYSLSAFLCMLCSENNRYLQNKTSSTFSFQTKLVLLCIVVLITLLYDINQLWKFQNNNYCSLYEISRKQYISRLISFVIFSYHLLLSNSPYKIIFLIFNFIMKFKKIHHPAEKVYFPRRIKMMRKMQFRLFFN